MKRDIRAIDEKHAANLTKKILSLTGPVYAEILKGGYSGCYTFVVNSNSQKYVIRFLENKSKDFRQKEITNLKIASKKGCGPHIYFADVEQSVVIMEYLLNQNISQQQRESDLLYIELAKLLQKIHSGQTFEGCINIFDWIQGQIDNVKNFVETKAIKGIPLIKLEDIIKIASEVFSSDAVKLPCHNDLNPGNLMFLGDKFKAIDYEHAAMGNPYYDIAQILIFNCTSIINEKILLFSYFGRQPTKDEEAKIYLMKLAAWIFDSVFLLQVYPEKLYKYENLQLPSNIDFIKEMAKGKIDLENPEEVLKYSKFVINHVITEFESLEFDKAVKNIE